jgi:hypothetical protein
VHACLLVGRSLSIWFANVHQQEEIAVTQKFPGKQKESFLNMARSKVAGGTVPMACVNVSLQFELQPDDATLAGASGPILSDAVQVMFFRLLAGCWLDPAADGLCKRNVNVLGSTT